jgi:hypothetical protein
VVNKDLGPQTKMQLDQIIKTLNGMPIGAPLVWVWVWDIISDKYNTYKEPNEYNDYVITEGITLDNIWEKLWANPPTEFTLEYGAEYVDEAIQDWMIDNDYLATLEEDGWLDDEDSDDVPSDNTTEYGTQEAGFKAEPVVLEGSTQ